MFPLTIMWFKVSHSVQLCRGLCVQSSVSLCNCVISLPPDQLTDR